MLAAKSHQRQLRKSLFWALLLLIIIVYVFGIIFVQARPRERMLGLQGFFVGVALGPFSGVQAETQRMCLVRLSERASLVVDAVGFRTCLALEVVAGRIVKAALPISSGRHVHCSWCILCPPLSRRSCYLRVFFWKQATGTSASVDGSR